MVHCPVSLISAPRITIYPLKSLMIPDLLVGIWDSMAPFPRLPLLVAQAEAY